MKYAVELKSGCSPAAFMANGKAVELTDENPRFETDDESEYRGLLDLPFLKAVSEAKPKQAKGAD